MALKDNFYNEIFEKEQKWIELINLNLLNSIYCNLTLKPFYLDKKSELEREYNKVNNEIMRQIISIINNIINKIDIYNMQYKNNEFVDIKSLIPLFLMTQMNNVVSKQVLDTNEINVQSDMNNKKKI